MDVSENSGTPKASILIGCSMVFHYKRSILGYPYFWKPPNNPCWFVTVWTPHRVAGKHVKFSWVLSRLEMRKHFMITPWFKWQSRHPRKSRYKPGTKKKSSPKILVSSLISTKNWGKGWIGCKLGRICGGFTPHPVTVTARMITFLEGNLYKPSFATG